MGNTNEIRLAIVDNDETALIGLCLIIKRQLPNVRIAWTTSNGKIAIEKALDPTDAVDVVLVDMSLEDVPGTVVCREIRSRSSSPALLAMTSFSLRRYANSVAENGAQGIVGKTDFKILGEAIKQVASGGTFNACEYAKSARFTLPEIAYKRIKHSSDASVTTLSKRELQIVELYVRGMRQREIAKKLSISVSTVKTTLKRAQVKMQVVSCADLVASWWKAHNDYTD